MKLEMNNMEGISLFWEGLCVETCYGVSGEETLDISRLERDDQLER